MHARACAYALLCSCLHTLLAPPPKPRTTAAPKRYDLRLLGPTEGQGLLLVWFNKRWYTISRGGDEGYFNTSAATVAW